MFVLKSAKCPSCRYRLKLSPGWLEFRLPPESVPCNHCNHPVRTTFSHRTHWLTSLSFRFIILGLFLYLQLLHAPEQGFFGNLIVAVVAGWFVTLLFGLLGAPVLQGFLDATNLMKGGLDSTPTGAKVSHAKAALSKGSEEERLAKAMGLYTGEEEALIVKTPESSRASSAYPGNPFSKEGEVARLSAASGVNPRETGED